jgi:dTDP-N-acetylfucosamine:lipid II N-acetylfucosaminyltransferase
MQLLHVIPDTNHIVSASFIRFVNTYFNNGKHTFVFFCKKRHILKSLCYYKNVHYVSKDNLIFLLKQYDKIIFHSFFYLTSIDKIKILIRPSLINKIVWVAWGGDLYEWHKKGLSFKKLLRNAVSYLFIKRIKYFVGIFPPDIDHFKREFKTGAKTYYASYVGALTNSLYNKRIENIRMWQKLACDEHINIQIGHSCTPALNHVNVLDTLHKFKNENIKIHVPLSYGYMEYGDEVERYAKTLFGDKVVCIREMMSLDNYMDFLSTMDIAIFNTSRQIGLGNIAPLLYMEKKVFIPAGSVMYEYYKSKGIHICNYNQISNMDFADFIAEYNMANACLPINIPFRK